MKIGFITYSFTAACRAGELDIFKMIDWIVEKGGEHLEISPSPATVMLNGDPAMTDKVRDYAAKRGLPLSSYTVGANFLTVTDENGVTRNKTAEERRAEIERVKTEVDVAARLGVHRMRHDVGYRAQADCTLANFEADLPLAVEACREIADYAAQFDIVTSTENHGYHFQGSERIGRLVAGVNRPNYRTTLDVGNFVCADEDPEIAVMNNLPIASMIHFKDFYLRKQVLCPDQWGMTRHGRYFRGAVTGCGDVDLPSIVKLIKASGYDGFLSIEYEGKEPNLAACEMALANVRKLFA